jgi:hypothetical protein
MRIKILSSAVEDLHAGRLFYEEQGEGIGEYFFDSLFSDIDSLALYAGIHQEAFGYHRLLSNRRQRLMNGRGGTRPSNSRMQAQTGGSASTPTVAQKQTDLRPSRMHATAGKPRVICNAL